jgi:hypothetical protein
MPCSPILPAAVLSVACVVLTACEPADLPSADQDAVSVSQRFFTWERQVEWDAWETEPDAAPAVDMLELCTTERLNRLDRSHMLDVDGNGSVDVICEVGGGFEGSVTTMHLLDDGLYRLAFSAYGLIVDLGRDSARGAVSFTLLTPRCCGDPRVLYEFYASQWEGDSVRFEVREKRVLNELFVLPATGLESPVPFEVENESYNLRWSPVIDDADTTESSTLYGDQSEPGNAVARYTTGGRGVALAQAADRTGRVWWFVLMDTTRPPIWTLDDEYYEPSNSALPAKRYGWMSSRYLAPLDSTAAPAGAVQVHVGELLLGHRCPPCMAWLDENPSATAEETEAYLRRERERRFVDDRPSLTIATDAEFGEIVDWAAKRR